jgi:hypothetical protein
VIPATWLNLIDAESRELEELLIEHGDIFAMKSDDFGCTDIDTQEPRPIRQLSRKLLLAKQAYVGDMLEDTKRRGVIEESDHLWSCPIILRDLRFCVDYRKRNDVIR